WPKAPMPDGASMEASRGNAATHVAAGDLARPPNAQKPPRRERESSGCVIVSVGKRVCALIIVLELAGCAGATGQATIPERDARSPGYPAHWWAPVPGTEAASWEILPQAAGRGEVILSKRNELGLLSNLAPTPFVFHGRRYASLEGFWQMMKYPEGPTDPRATWPGVVWKYTREEVSQMAGFDAKTAGDLGSENMKTMGIDWVTFEGRKMRYRTGERGEHYALIVEATREKIRQNPRVRDVLLSTGDLKLRPDHRQASDAPPAWRYCDILMMIRAELQEGAAPAD
ncbi:MAG TPA: NADAR family protein, partial [Phycisphaerae bacterium]|nr:NADAR family protein [Phycisphaerae bacterium]